MEHNNVNCNLCNSNNYTELYAANKAQVHRIVQCNDCELMYANPQTDNVTSVELDHLNNYPETFDMDINEILKDFTPEKHQYLKKQYLQLNDYKKILDFVEKPVKGKMLEVGSYAGVFLFEAKKRGWEVIGSEPLELPALYSERLGVKVLRNYFEDINLPNNSLDVLIATHVIEHVNDPSFFVEKAYNLLKPKGTLILETPTYDSLSYKLLQHRERSIRCNGHLFFFTKKTLIKLAEKCGFKIIKYEKVGRTLTLDRLFYNFGVISGKKDFFSNLSKKMKLNNFKIKINTRDMQRIYCEKH